MTDARTRLVGEDYDKIGDRFVEWRARIEDDPRSRWLEELTKRLPADARVLELGCGARVPTMVEPEPDGEGQWHWVLARAGAAP